jgi:protein SCO1
VRIGSILTLVLLCTALARGAQDPRTIPLLDQRGTPFTLADLRGRPVAVTFVASRCTDVCPISNAAFASLARKLARDGKAAVLVTITLDPRYDTPFVMSQLAREMDADPKRWLLASGSQANVTALMHAFGIVVRADKAGIPDEHSSFVYVLDRHGRLQRTLLLSNHLVDDASHALEQP